MTDKARILITRHLYPKAVEMLETVGEITYHDRYDGLENDVLIAEMARHQAVVSQLTDPIRADAIAAAGDDLKIIANAAAGFDNIDLAAASRRGIRVTNTPGVLTEATADLAFTLMLAAARRIVEADRFVREGRWTGWQVDLLCGHDLHGEVMGLIGLGRIGQAMARRAHGFGMPILYTDTEPAPEALEKELGLRFVPLDELLVESHYVSLHVPLTDATHHVLGAAQFDHMRDDAILVNTARGPVVDEKALVVALREGQIAAAGLDVFEREPALEAGLLELDNVVLAPHIGSASTRSREQMCTLAAVNVIAALQGKMPPHVVNKDVLD